jgi:hypothetical protein
MRLRFPSDSVVVVAGVPGAGKTTLIRRAVDRDAVRVVDTDDRRDGRRRPLLYAGHYARIAAAVAGRRPAVSRPEGEGWASVVLLSRDQAARTQAIEFPAPEPARGRPIAAATM